MPSMSHQEVQLKLVEILRGQSINPDLPLSLLEQIDSLQILGLMTALEDEFKVQIGAFDVNEQNFENIDLLAAYIQKKQNPS